MNFFKKIALILVMCIGFWSQVFAENPFTDIPRNSPYYEAVDDLYNNGVISDNGSHLFRPNDTMKRDFYVSLVVGVGCKKCTTPSTEDIRKYTTSPYIDLPKINPYFYCIAYADDKKIVRGYVLDQNGQTSCQDKNTYTSTPFCAKNTTTRIEAAAILLRRANLWNEELNKKNTDFSLKIPDADKYWYGYAKKAIEVGLIKPRSDGNIGQYEAITRWEFAIMASKILGFTQCNSIKNENLLEAKIIIQQNGQDTKKTEFLKDEKCVLLPKTSQSGNWKYLWTIKNRNGEIKKIKQKEIECKDLKEGTSDIDVQIIDPKTEKPLSNPTTTINIKKNPNDEVSGLGVILDAEPLIGTTDTNFTFVTSVSETKNPTTQRIDFWDGTQTTSTEDVKTYTDNHTYETPWVYTVTSTVTDTKTGKTGQSTVIVTVKEDEDPDKDWILNCTEKRKTNCDECPFVKGIRENKWCPPINPWEHTCKIRKQYGENIICDDPRDPKIDTQIIITQDDTPTNKTSFTSDEKCVFVPKISEGGQWKYEWTVTYPNGKVEKFSRETIQCDDLEVGTPTVEVEIIDPKTNKPVGDPEVTVNITDPKNPIDPKNPNANAIGVSLYANPQKQYLWEEIVFQVNVEKTKNPTEKIIEFWDGKNFIVTDERIKIPLSHAYETTGIYTVKTRAKDIKTGKIGTAKVQVKIINNEDPDEDGVLNCTEKRKTNCDKCPLIKGPKDNNGCPITNPTTPTFPNICILEKVKNQGVVQGGAICNECPYYNSLTISSLVRECDTLFPTILSPAPDLSTVYSRGSFYLVR